MSTAFFQIPGAQTGTRNILPLINNDLPEGGAFERDDPE